MNKKFIQTAAVFLFITSFIFSQNVNEDEIRSISGDNVVFENYEGPHTVIETVEAINFIGTSLGQRLTAQGLTQSAVIGSGENTRLFTQ